MVVTDLICSFSRIETNRPFDLLANAQALSMPREALFHRICHVGLELSVVGISLARRACATRCAGFLRRLTLLRMRQETLNSHSGLLVDGTSLHCWRPRTSRKDASSSVLLPLWSAQWELWNSIGWRYSLSGTAIPGEVVKDNGFQRLEQPASFSRMPLRRTPSSTLSSSSIQKQHARPVAFERGISGPGRKKSRPLEVSLHRLPVLVLAFGELSMESLLQSFVEAADGLLLGHPAVALGAASTCVFLQPRATESCQLALPLLAGLRAEAASGASRRGRRPGPSPGQ